METKTKLIEFDLERALQIQNGEEKGKIVTRCGHATRIICTDAKRKSYPIIGLVYNPVLPGDEVICFTKTGEYTDDNLEHNYDLLLEIPIEQKQFDLKPFDKVLVRNDANEEWSIDLFSHYKHNNCDLLIVKCIYNTWYECIPYNDDTKHLFRTTNPFKY